MKEQTSGVTTKEVLGLNPKMYLFLVDDNCEN